MKKVFLSLAATALAVSMSAAVTPFFGVEAGYDHGLAHLRSSYTGYSYYTDVTKMDGFHIGGNVQLDFSQGQHIPSLVLGLNYQFLANNIASWDAKTKTAIDTYKSNMKAMGASNIKASDYAYMHTLQIPIRFQYTYQINNDWRFFALTGPQVRLHMAFTETENLSCTYDGKKNGYYSNEDYVSGKMTLKTWENGVKQSETETMEKLTRLNCFDMSWGFGIGCGWNALSLSFTYDLGMINLFNKDLVKNAKSIDQYLRLNSDALAVTIGYRIK